MACVKVLLPFFVVLSAASAQAEDWSAFNACLSENVNAVDQAETSISGGADLIVDVLCLNEASELGNRMLKERKGVVEQKGLESAFDAFLYVMKRESRRAIFETRKIRLGL